MRRYVTFHPWGHEPADSLVLAGVLRAVWAVHEVPVVLDREADGSIIVADLPVPTLQVVQEPDLDEDSDDEPEVEPEPEPPATKPAPARKAPSAPAKRPAAKGTKLADDDIVAAVRQNGPATASVLARHLEVRSVGGFTRQLRRIASTGRIELANGGTWRVPQAAATNGTGAAVVPAKPGGGVTVGPVERRPFDPEAARLRAAGEL